MPFGKKQAYAEKVRKTYTSNQSLQFPITNESLPLLEVWSQKQNVTLKSKHAVPYKY